MLWTKESVKVGTPGHTGVRILGIFPPKEILIPAILLVVAICFEETSILFIQPPLDHWIWGRYPNEKSDIHLIMSGLFLSGSELYPTIFHIF